MWGTVGESPVKGDSAFEGRAGRVHMPGDDAKAPRPEREYSADSDQPADDGSWYFDLPKGAWERQEEKNRQLRQNVRGNFEQQEAADAAAARRDPFKNTGKESVRDASAWRGNYGNTAPAEAPGWDEAVEDEPIEVGAAHVQEVPADASVLPDDGPAIPGDGGETEQGLSAMRQWAHSAVEDSARAHLHLVKDGELSDGDAAPPPGGPPPGIPPLKLVRRAHEDESEEDPTEPKTRFDEMFAQKADGGGMLESMREWARHAPEKDEPEGAHGLSALPAKLFKPFDWEAESADVTASGEPEGRHDGPDAPSDALAAPEPMLADEAPAVQAPKKRGRFARLFGKDEDDQPAPEVEETTGWAVIEEGTGDGASEWAPMTDAAPVEPSVSEEEHELGPASADAAHAPAGWTPPDGAASEVEPGEGIAASLDGSAEGPDFGMGAPLAAEEPAVMEWETDAVPDEPVLAPRADSEPSTLHAGFVPSEPNRDEEPEAAGETPDAAQAHPPVQGSFADWKEPALTPRTTPQAVSNGDLWAAVSGETETVKELPPPSEEYGSDWEPEPPSAWGTGSASLASAEAIELPATIENEEPAPAAWNTPVVEGADSPDEDPLAAIVPDDWLKSDAQTPAPETTASTAAASDDEDPWAAVVAASGYDDAHASSTPVFMEARHERHVSEDEFLHELAEGDAAAVVETAPADGSRWGPHAEDDTLLKAFEAHASGEVDVPHPRDLDLDLDGLAEPGAEAFEPLLGRHAAELVEAASVVDDPFFPKQVPWTPPPMPGAAPARPRPPVREGWEETEDGEDSPFPELYSTPVTGYIGEYDVAAAAPGERKHSRSRTLIRELIETALLALLVFLAVRASFQNFKVDGTSMYPTLENGQFLIVNKLLYSEVDVEKLSRFLPFLDAGESPKRYLFHGPERGDIVVVVDPRDPKVDLIKRVIGLPGETIEIVDGKVYVNGFLLEEPYIKQQWHSTNPKVVIPAGEYFVMGDNRENSLDSRSPNVGLVPKDLVIGKAMLSYWPREKFGMAPNEAPRLTETALAPKAAEAPAK
jgi:signal peptidase I